MAAGLTMSQTASRPDRAIPADSETLRDRIGARAASPGGGSGGGSDGGAGADAGGDAGLPPRPDPVTEPTLFSLWQAMVARPCAPVLPDIASSDQDRVDYPRNGHRPVVTGSGLGRGHVMGSRNWSGALVAPGGAGRLTTVGASWTVPDVAPDPAFAPLDDVWRCSIWAGLDGHFAFAQSMPQLGTESSVATDGVQRHRAWIQWWVPDTDTRPHYIDNLPVVAGAEIGCYLWVTAPDQVGLMLRRLDDPAIPPVRLFLRAPVILPGQRARVLGTTAEWVLERPMQVGSTALYPLPRFAPVTLRRAATNARGPATAAGARDALIGARLIRMFAAVPVPAPTGAEDLPMIDAAVRIASAERMGSNEVRVARVGA